MADAEGVADGVGDGDAVGLDDAPGEPEGLGEAEVDRAGEPDGLGEGEGDGLAEGEPDGLAAGEALAVGEGVTGGGVEGVGVGSSAFAYAGNMTRSARPNTAPSRNVRSIHPRDCTRALIHRTQVHPAAERASTGGSVPRSPSHRPAAARALSRDP